MGVRYRKSIKIGKGMKLSFGKKGASMSFGTKGLHYTINTSGNEHRLLVFPEQGHRLSVHPGEERDHQRENRQVEERKQDQGI